MKQVITVDFDQTLAFESVTNTGWICVGTGILKPIKAIHDLVREKHKEGFEIHIVTFRASEDVVEILNFVEMYDLPIKKVHCTESKSKTPVLKKLNSQLHIDDSLSVCVGAKMEGIDVIYVNYGQTLDESQQELALTLNQIHINLI